MKKSLLILTLFLSLLSFAQSNFSNGFSDGYKKGYCHNQGVGCISPIPPISPNPKVNENMNSYQDGYNRGFEEGLNAQKNKQTNSENQTRERFKTSEVEFVEDGIYNPYKDQNTLNLAIKVAELKSKRLSELYEKGIENYNNDNYSDAIYYANEIIKIEPTISQAYALKAMSQLYKGEILNSFNNINKAKKLNYSGEDNVTHINKEVQEYLKNQMAEKNYNNVINFCKNSWYENNLTNYFLAMGYYYNQDYKTAKKYFKKFDFEPSKTYLDAIKENKILPNPFTKQNQKNENVKETRKGVFANKEALVKYVENIANLFSLKKYKEVINEVNLEIQNIPTDFKYGFEFLYGMRGSSNYYLGNYYDAINDFKVSIQNSEKTNPNIYYLSALSKSETKDLLGAISDYDKLIEIGVNGKGNLYDLATVYNNKAYALTNMKKYSEAKILVEEALKMNKSYWYIWDTKGEIEYNLGNFNQCIEDMNKAISLKQDSNSLFFRGLSYIKLGKTDLGCKDLKKSGELGKKDAYYEINKYCK